MVIIAKFLIAYFFAVVVLVKVRIESYETKNHREFYNSDNFNLNLQFWRILLF
jgi:hypothetical protein